MFLLLGRELLSGGVPARPAGLSKMSSKGSELLPLAFQGCWKALSLLGEDELLCPGEAELPSPRAVMADASDPEAALSDLQAARHT